MGSAAASHHVCLVSGDVVGVAVEVEVHGHGEAEAGLVHRDDVVLGVEVVQVDPDAGRQGSEGEVRRLDLVTRGGR